MIAIVSGVLAHSFALSLPLCLDGAFDRIFEFARVKQSADLYAQDGFDQVNQIVGVEEFDLYKLDDVRDGGRFMTKYVEQFFDLHEHPRLGDDHKSA